jgi:ribosomal protein S18 acetylase RimI-like enzyme
MSELTFRVALEQDAEAIARIVNAAYRPQEGAGGWTHEAHLVRGDRTTPRQVRELIRGSSVIVGQSAQTIICSAHIALDHGAANIGMLAVNPSLQGTGVGKVVLDHAERYAAEVLGATEIVLFVLRDRPELIAFYVRRGYEQTGEFQPYPTGLGGGAPVSNGLELEILRKRVNKSLQVRRP